MDVDVNEIKKKIDDLQKYVPNLMKLIDDLQKDDSKEAKLNEMQLFHNLLTNPDEGTTMSMLTECEEILKACFEQGEKKSLTNVEKSNADEEIDSASSTSSVTVEKNDDCETPLSMELNDKDENEYKSTCVENKSTEKYENSKEIEKISKVNPLDQINVEESAAEKILTTTNEEQLKEEVRQEGNSVVESTLVSETEVNTLRETKTCHGDKIVDTNREESIEMESVPTILESTAEGKESENNKMQAVEESIQDSDEKDHESMVNAEQQNELDANGDLCETSSTISKANKIEDESKQNETRFEASQDPNNSDNQKANLEKLTSESKNNDDMKSETDSESNDTKSTKASDKCDIEQDSVIENKESHDVKFNSEEKTELEQEDNENIETESQLKQKITQEEFLNEKSSNDENTELALRTKERTNEEKVSDETENNKVERTTALGSSEKMEYEGVELESTDSGTVIEKSEEKSAENTENMEMESESEVEIVSVDKPKAESEQKSVSENDESVVKNQDNELETKLEKSKIEQDVKECDEVTTAMDQSSKVTENNEPNSLISLSESTETGQVDAKEDKVSGTDSNQIDSRLNKVEDKKPETTRGNIKDPLSLDKDFQTQTKKGSSKKNQYQTRENLLSTLIVSESDVERLVKLQELKRLLEQKSVPPLALIETTHSAKPQVSNVEKIKLKPASKPSSSPSPSKDKPAVVYLIKKDPKKSVETIELLDSDDEYNQDNYDDDVILVSAKGLKKQPTANKQSKTVVKPSTKKSKNSAVSQTSTNKPIKTVAAVAKSLVTSSKPMFAISAVQSFGKPKSTALTTTIKKPGISSKNISITKRTIESDIKKHQSSSSSSPSPSPSSSNKSSTVVGTTTSKKNNLSVTSEYQQATLRVCTPIKDLEISKNPKDFLSAFQSFSANKNLNQKFVISRAKTNKSNKRNIISINDDSTTSCDSISYSSNSSNPIVSNKINDDQINKEWLDNFITNILSPTQIKSKHVLEILQKSLEPERYHQLKTIIDSHNNPDEVFSYIVSEKILIVLPNGRTTEKVQLIVKPINQVNVDELNKEIRELFIKDGVLTEIGKKLCKISETLNNSKNTNKVLTTDRNNGQVTSRSRKSRCDRTGEIDDDEYAPNISVDVNEEVTQERRRSLRRDNRKIDWKPYFTYDEEDDDTIIAHQLKKPKNENKRKHSNGESVAERERKKIKIESGTSIQTPFDTDLLTPTWFESEDLEGSNSQPYAAPATDSNYASTHEEGPSYTSHDDFKMEEDAPQNNETSASGNVEKVLVTKNTNPIYHCRSKFVDACLLCGEKVQHAVSHYVNQHPEQEVIISRITQKDVSYILQNINYAFITNQRERETVTGRGYQYTAMCVFCKRDMNFALRYWWEHFTMHTGEYGYECSGCKVKRPRKQSTQVHINGQCKKSKKAKVKEIYEFDKSITEIHAHICTLCNYVQLHRENVEKHVRTQHDISLYEIQSHIVMVSLIQFAKPYMEAGNGIVGGGGSGGGSGSGGGDLNQTATNLPIGETATVSEYNSINNSMAEFMEYSNIMQSNDDLSFMICNMLATDVPELEQKNDNDRSKEEQNNKKR